MSGEPDDGERQRGRGQQQPTAAASGAAPSGGGARATRPIPTIAPPPDRAGGLNARRKRREARSMAKARKHKQDGAVKGQYAPGRSTLGLELVASPDLLAKNDDWKTRDRAARDGDEEDAEEEEPAPTKNAAGGEEERRQDAKQQRQRQQNPPNLVSPDKPAENERSPSSSKQPIGEQPSAVVTPEQPEKKGRSRLKLGGRLGGSGKDAPSSPEYASLYTPPKPKEDPSAGGAGRDRRDSGREEDALVPTKTMTAGSRYRSLSRGRSRGGAGGALRGMRRLGASQRDTPSSSSAPQLGPALTSSLLAADGDSPPEAGGAARQSSFARAASAKQRRMQQLRARSAERDGKERQKQPQLPLPQLKWDEHHRSKSMPRQRPSEDEIFGGLDEPFDEAADDAGVARVPKRAAADDEEAAAAAKTAEMLNEDAHDFLKTKGLESVRAARSGRVRSFFSSRRNVGSTGGKAGRKARSSSSAPDAAADAAPDDEDALMKTPARSNRSGDDNGGGGGGGSTSRKVAGFLRNRTFKSRDGNNAKGSPGGTGTTAGTPSSGSTTDSSSVATKNSAEAESSNAANPAIPEDKATQMGRDGPSATLAQAPATPASILKPPTPKNARLPSPAVVRDRRAKLIVQEQEEEARQKQILRERRVKMQELERMRAELERVDFIESQAARRVTFEREALGMRSSGLTSTPSLDPAPSPGHPPLPPHMMASPPLSSRQRSGTPSPPVPDPKISDYFCKPTVSSSVIHESPPVGGLCPAMPVMDGAPGGGDGGLAAGRERLLAGSELAASTAKHASPPPASAAASTATPTVPMKRVVSNDSPTGVEEVCGASNSFRVDDGDSVAGSVTISVINGSTKSKKGGKDASPSKSVDSWNSEDTEVTCNTTERNGGGAGRRKERGEGTEGGLDEQPSIEVVARDSGSRDLDLEELAGSGGLCNFSWVVDCWKPGGCQSKARKSPEEVIKDDEAVDQIIQAALDRSDFAIEGETAAAAAGVNETLNMSKVELELDDKKSQLKITPRSRPKTEGQEGGGEGGGGIREGGKRPPPPLMEDERLTPEARQRIQRHSSSPLLDEDDDDDEEGDAEEEEKRRGGMRPPDIKRDIQPLELFKDRNEDGRGDDDDEDAAADADGQSRTVVSEVREEYSVDESGRNNSLLSGGTFDASASMMSTLDDTIGTYDNTIETHENTLETLDEDDEEGTTTTTANDDDRKVGVLGPSSSAGCTVLPNDLRGIASNMVPSWMDGYNGILDVVDKIDDAINGKLCKEEASDYSGTDDDTIDSEDLHGDLGGGGNRRSRNSRRYVSERRSGRMREQRARRRQKLEARARRHRRRAGGGGGEESVQTENVLSEGGTDTETEDDRSTERRYQVRFSPGTIVDESEGDGADGGENCVHGGGSDEGCDDEESEGDTLRSATPDTLADTLRSETPNSLATAETTSTGTTATTGRSAPNANARSSPGPVDLDDTIPDEDDIDDDELDEHIRRALANARKGERELEESNGAAESPERREEDSFDVVHSLGESPPKAAACVPAAGVPPLRPPVVLQKDASVAAGVPPLQGPPAVQRKDATSSPGSGGSSDAGGNGDPPGLEGPPPPKAGGGGDPVRSRGGSGVAAPRKMVAGISRSIQTKSKGFKIPSRGGGGRAGGGGRVAERIAKFSQGGSRGAHS